MSENLSGAFDRERQMMKLMLDQGKLPTGNGTYMEVSAEVADRIKEEIDAGASFSTSEIVDVEYNDGPGGTG